MRIQGTQGRGALDAGMIRSILDHLLRGLFETSYNSVLVDIGE